VGEKRCFKGREIRNGNLEMREKFTNREAEEVFLVRQTRSGL